MTLDAGPFFLTFRRLILAGLFLWVAGCGNDEDGGNGNQPGRLVIVTTAAELREALTTAAAGDTVEIDGGFADPRFVMDQGFHFGPEVSPLYIQTGPRSLLRPEIVFPPGVDGFTFEGHSGSRLLNLAIRGGRSAIVLNDSRVLADTLTITDPARDGVEATGGGSDGRVRGCLIEFVPATRGGQTGRFGVSTGDGARLGIENNTVIEAGDCGLYVGANNRVVNNNIYRAHNFGAYFDENSAAPDVRCNNAFASVTENFRSARNLDFSGNYELDPLFCPGSWNPRDASPLTNPGAGCGTLIGALPALPGCESAAPAVSR